MILENTCPSDENNFAIITQNRLIDTIMNGRKLLIYEISEVQFIN